MGENPKNMTVEAGLMVRLVELKKAYGLRSLSAVIAYLLDQVPAQELDLVSQRVELQREYQAALKACKELRELVSQPIQPTYEMKPLRTVMLVDTYRLTNNQ